MTPKNLLIIMSDEHNRDFSGFAGHPVVATPNLDCLAERGTVFRSAYANSPICVPSRASFATGCYPHQTGHWDNAHPYCGTPPSWGQRAIDQGHRCASVGKLHYRDTRDANGFDQEILPLHVVAGIGDPFGMIREDMPKRPSMPKLANEAGRGWSSYTRYDREVAAAAADWIGAQAQQAHGKPWILFVSFVCPHFPLIAPPEFYDLYADNPPWPELYRASERPTHPFHRKLQEVIDYDNYFDDAKVRKAVAAYLGLITFLDDNIGTVLKALQAAGLSQETRILYTSDHGESLGKRGNWGKSTMFEESVAVPLVLSGPDIPAGKNVNTTVSLVDCHPTILEAVGVAPHPDDADLPGRSLFTIASEPDATRVVFSEYHAAGAPTGSFMIREGRYKLFWFAGMCPELYDLETDPDETRDLAADPAYEQTLARLEHRLREICDPDAVDRRAKSDQHKLIEAYGGREAILKRGCFLYTPAPGEKAQLSK